MKVTMRTRMASQCGVVKPGETIEVSKDLGDSMIAKGYAKAVTLSGTKRTEKAVVSGRGEKAVDN